MLQIEQMYLAMDGFELRANWSLAAGERLAVIGPSGAGKSTLLGVLSGFLPLKSGKIRWAGADITALEPGERPLTILFQDQNLFAHLSIADNLGLGLRPSLRLTQAERDAIEVALERTGLAGLGARKPAQLSGGQQSRAALARALLRNRPLLLLDEPFAALGPALKAEMLDLVNELATANGTTVIMVTHDPKDARRLAPLTTVVADGIAQAPAPTGALLANPPPALAAYLGGELGED